MISMYVSSSFVDIVFADQVRENERVVYGHSSEVMKSILLINCWMRVIRIWIQMSH